MFQLRCSSWIKKRQRNQRSNCQHPLDHRKNKRNSRKTPALLTMPKPLTVWIISNYEKFLNRWEYQITLPASWEIAVEGGDTNTACGGLTTPKSRNWKEIQPVHSEGDQVFFWNSTAYSMIQQMLAIWSLVPLPFLKIVWTSESSKFTYCWSLAWRILSITLLACEMSAIVQ